MSLKHSYDWCGRVAKRRARNFYPSFLLLSRPQHHAICAIYAFMRYCDDLADDGRIKDRAAKISQWRTDLKSALAGQPPAHPLWPAFLEALARYSIPDRYFFDMIAGVNSDLEPRQLCTFDELYQYCYQVAGTVGLTIMHIYGFKKSEATKVRRLAEKCGVAFQLTNILRDIREDAARGRVYLPNDDLKRFHVEKFSYDERFRALMEFEVTRARNYYDEALPLLELVSDEGRPSLKALIRSYSRLLDRIVEADYNVLTRRISVSKVELLRIAARAQAEHLRSKIKRPTNSDRG